MLKADKISKTYYDRVGYRINLLKEISLEISSNEFVSLIAPVGSGKTSLLKILAGLELPTNGSIKSELKKRIYIPSKPSSFPWLTVFENISFNSGLPVSKIEEYIDLVGLKGYEDHIPHNKSEGFRFRISLGRALTNNPELLLIDEPFNNLKTSTREEIYELIRNVHKKSSIPFILGTTNISEAVFLSDRQYLMKKNPGEIIEVLDDKLPTERGISIMQEKKFISVRSEIEQIFHDKAGRQLYNFSI